MFGEIFHPQDLRDWIDTILYFITCIICGITSIQWYHYNKNKDEKKRKRVTSLIITSFIFIFVASLYHISNLERQDLLKIYNRALEYEENEEWDKAYQEFDKLVNRNGTFKDSNKHLEYIYPRYMYQCGKENIKYKRYDVAYEFFHNAGDYMNARFFADYCYFMYLTEQHPEWLYDRALYD